jgi:hypothetical protein
MISPSRVFEEARPLRVFKEARLWESPEGARKTEVFSGKLKNRRQTPYGLRGTTAREIYPTNSVILIMGRKTTTF